MDVNNQPPEMSFLRSVGLVITYKCQIACPHCIIRAGPHRQEQMPLEDALDWIRQIADYRNGYIKVLALTGGEPFYDIQKLKKIAVFGQEHGLLVSAVTNAFWASTPDRAAQVLDDLSAIELISISTDAYHLESIPFENVKNAVSAIRARDIPYTIAICTENEDDAKYKYILNRLYEITEPDSVRTVVTFPAGRALQKIGISKYCMKEQPPISACSNGSSPIIFPFGRVIACIGPVIDLHTPHPLVLGDLRTDSLAQILDKAELNTILHAIRTWGPHKLIRMAADAGLAHLLPSKYVKDSTCNACYCLMSSPHIIPFLHRMAEDPEFGRKVAYARAYYFGETRAIQLGQFDSHTENLKHPANLAD
ncbi:MAG: radical SAM/SPASM domain-containing protein [Planctomycetota bacterium]|jgi:MoaA/NifB/PqqE/SkfB family radical SAM enzyme